MRSWKLCTNIGTRRTLISTAHPLPPTKSVARTAFLRPLSILSFARLWLGRCSSARSESSWSHARSTRTASSRGRNFFGTSRSITACWKMIVGSSGSSSSPSASWGCWYCSGASCSRSSRTGALRSRSAVPSKTGCGGPEYEKTMLDPPSEMYFQCCGEVSARRGVSVIVAS